MKKHLLFICILFLSVQELYATHIIGGVMRYEYMGPGLAPNSKRYTIRLLLLRGGTGAPFINQYIVGVFNDDNGQKIIGPAINNNWAAVEDFTTPLPVPIIISPCIQNPPNLDYTYKTYSFVIELLNNANGYTVAFQTYSRQTSDNIFANQGATYSCNIPGTNVLPNPQFDNSPIYSLPISVICENSSFTLDFSATDPDGDSLVYNFCDAFNGGAATLANFQDPAPPPYGSVSYSGIYTSSQPMGNGVTINPSTGIISGIAPSAGRYVVCVCASVYRNGVLISVHRKDLIIEVSGCIPLAANPNFVPITCDGFTVTFNQSSTGNPTSFFWDFGDPASGVNNTSILPNPVHTFTDTGVFNIKFIVSIAGLCIDSVIRTISVYPGFLPGFTQSPTCINIPVQFNDTTYSRYGVIDSWRWDFGDLSTLADTSHLPNPIYSYPAAGNYTVELRVTNSKGCNKIYSKLITINANPIVSILPRDTLYCGLDSLMLNASGAGTHNWLPATNIINANTASPSVFPTLPTRYVVTLTDVAGCKAKDSILVTPKFDLTNSIIANPTTICEEDTLLLSGNSNYSANASWQWTPAISVQNPSQQNSNAFPIVTTNYTLVTRWGNNCVATSTQNIIVRPLAIPNAGPDVVICNNIISAQLNATGGNTYSWMPTTGLSNPNIANPIATPLITTTYIVAVGVTGCTKTRVDSMQVIKSVLPPLNSTNDTLICTIDTLQINSSGVGNFTWSPNYNISNVNIINPLVSPDVPTMYYVRMTDAFGCYRDDSVFVDVKAFVTLNAGPDTTICQTDGFFLNINSDALSYRWIPSAGLSNDAIKNPLATPLSTTTYTVIGNIGKCQTVDDITINVVPYPIANAGPDAAICFGFSTQLNATGGSNYAWSPATFLNNRLIQSPISVRPTANIRYIVTVRDTLGCPKPVKDTVWVMVYPKVVPDAGPADTIVVLGEPLFLRASGALTYVWTPDTWLNNANIENPVSKPQDNIKYVLTGTTAQGCIGQDSIFVTLYKMDPDLYVPTAFSPNGDGNNDVLRPILLGMKKLNYFRVYNRWGRLMYSTTEQYRGWDGRFNGKAQDPATFVWMAEGLNYKGEVRRKKGYAVLIR